MWYTEAYEPKPSISLEDMPDEMLLHIFENSSLDELANLYDINYRLRAIAIDIVRTRFCYNDRDDLELIIASYDNKINLVVHGDDKSPHFNEQHKVPIELGIMKYLKYTNGVSTTELIERIKCS